MTTDTDILVSATPIVLNGAVVRTRARTLTELIEEAGFAGVRVATAVNGRFIAELRRGETELADGDRVEVVSPRQGG